MFQFQMQFWLAKDSTVISPVDLPPSPIVKLSGKYYISKCFYLLCCRVFILTYNVWESLPNPLDFSLQYKMSQ